MGFGKWKKSVPPRQTHVFPALDRKNRYEYVLQICEIVQLKRQTRTGCGFGVYVFDVTLVLGSCGKVPSPAHQDIPFERRELKGYGFVTNPSSVIALKRRNVKASKR